MTIDKKRVCTKFTLSMRRKNSIENLASRNKKEPGKHFQGTEAIKYDHADFGKNQIELHKLKIQQLK